MLTCNILVGRSQHGDVLIVSLLDSYVCARRWRLVIAIVRPSHPVQRSVYSAEISLSRMEVRRPLTLVSG